MKALLSKINADRKKLIAWYLKYKRDLPWRNRTDAYGIWISEVMLQQTTTTAVLPFYIRFMERFPDIHSLAEARLEDVYTYWAGLGYYSRARNIHKTAKYVSENLNGVFPDTYQKLIELPGFGPYTSRAVASFSFNQPVGVLDGNVIRILTRKYGLDIEWWKTKERNKLQELADLLANTPENALVNQAMMELGSTVCTPKKVMCITCPWSKDCKSITENKVAERPLPKPKKAHEIWNWTFFCAIKDNKLLLTPNTQTPFLKDNWLPPSEAQKLTKKPKSYKFKHNVTTFDIYVDIQMENKKKISGLKSVQENLFAQTQKNSMKDSTLSIQLANKTSNKAAVKFSNKTVTALASSKNSKKSIIENTEQWVHLDKVSEINPTSLIKKIITHI